MYLVNILVSTYNGQDYIEQQMESLLRQTYKNIRIYIRDDGSTDDTKKILKRYENIDDVNIIYGDNLGFLKSFNRLLEISKDGDYWAFCDQDDVWYEEKIARAVEWMTGNDNRIPLLYHCSYHLTNEQLKVMSTYSPWIKNYDFTRAITENIYSGFASVINGRLRELMLRGDWEQIEYHDCWMTLIVMSMGKSYFDEYVGAAHRRLQSSVSEEKMGKRITWALKSLFSESPLKRRNKEFYNEFKDDLDFCTQQIIKVFVMEKYNLIIALRKVFRFSKWRSKWSSDMVIRFLMLLNKV